MGRSRFGLGVRRVFVIDLCSCLNLNLEVSGLVLLGNIHKFVIIIDVVNILFNFLTKGISEMLC